MVLRKARVCAACTCCCCSFLPMFVGVLLSLMSVSVHPKFCVSEHRESGAAAVESRPPVYSDGGTVSYDSLSSGWNTGCGDIPTNFTEKAELYAPETGGLAIIQDDSGFRNSAWTFTNFKVWKVKTVEAVDSYPFGERAQTVQQVANLFSVNLFWMPTATSEVVGWNLLQYEVCAYFANPSGEVPNLRLYKTTESPLGASDPFVQQFVRAISDTEVEYRAISNRYNDEGDAVGAVTFVAEVTETCPVWSEAEGSYGFMAIIIVLAVVFALVLLGLGVCAWRKMFHVE